MWGWVGMGVGETEIKAKLSLKLNLKLTELGKNTFNKLKNIIEYEIFAQMFYHLMVHL